MAIPNFEFVSDVFSAASSGAVTLRVERVSSSHVAHGRKISFCLSVEPHETATATAATAHHLTISEADGCAVLRPAAALPGPCDSTADADAAAPPSTAVFQEEVSKGTTLLHVAAEHGDEKALRGLLEAGCAGISSETGDGFTPLDEACDAGHDDCVRTLIDYGADVGLQDSQACTPLHLAAQGDHPGCVALLVEAGAPVNAPDADGDTPLHAACANGSHRAARALLDACAAVDAKNAAGDTPLHAACHAGHAECADALLDWWADPDASNAKGWRPLHSAAHQGKALCTAVLLRRTLCDVDVVNNAGMSPLHHASISNDSESAELLLGACASVQPGVPLLMMAAHLGHARTLRTLLRASADPNNNTQRFTPPLMAAAKQGHADCVSLLIRHKAGLEVTTPDTQRTALHEAAAGGRADCMAVLRAAGAGDCPDVFGLTPDEIYRSYWDSLMAPKNGAVRVMCAQGKPAPAPAGSEVPPVS